MALLDNALKIVPAELRGALEKLIVDSISYNSKVRGELIDFLRKYSQVIKLPVHISSSPIDMTEAVLHLDLTRQVEISEETECLSASIIDVSGASPGKAIVDFLSFF